MKTGLVLMLGLLATALAPTAGAVDEPVEWFVQAGAVYPGDDPANPVTPYSYAKYYPPVLRVHRGDTVRWEAFGSPPDLGFHSITFLPGDDDAAHPPMVRADEDPSRVAFGEEWFLPSGCTDAAGLPTTGRGSAKPCVVSDTTQMRSSGILFFQPSPFRATVDLPPGNYRYHCTVHPSMHGTIEVEPDNETLPTPVEIAAQVTEEIRNDSLEADALVRDRSAPTFEIIGGRKVWQIRVGDATPAVQISQYLPSDLAIAPGDAVRFFLPETVEEPHSVSFPRRLWGDSNAVQDPARFASNPPGLGMVAFQPRCELDEPDEGAEGYLWQHLRVPCPAGTPELVFQPYTAHQQRAPGDAVLTPATVHNSGLMAPAEAPDWFKGRPAGSGVTMPFEFAASFPTLGQFQFSCTIHRGVMNGVVRVGS